MIHVLARINVSPESAAAAHEVLAKLAEASRKETGCRSYELLHRPDAPHVLQTIEEWDDQTCVDAHMQTPHLKDAMKVAKPMFTTPPEILSFVKAA